MIGSFLMTSSTHRLSSTHGLASTFTAPTTPSGSASARYRAGVAATGGLDDLGPPAGYVPRQIRRWRGQLDHARVRPVPDLDWAADWLEQIFGVRPVIADTTELMMSDNIYHALDAAGFKAGFMDGRPWVMDWRDSTRLYHHDGGQMKLLTRHYQLSDDVGYRFSDRNWPNWPLMADRYAGWLAETAGNLVVLGWDFETFGEHHRPESGIFDFMKALPAEVQ